MYRKKFDSLLFNFKNKKTKMEDFIKELKQEDYNISID